MLYPIFVGFRRFRKIGIIVRAVRAATQVVMPAIHGNSATATRLKIMPVCAFYDIAAVITAGYVPYDLSHFSALPVPNGSYKAEFTSVHFSCFVYNPS